MNRKVRLRIRREPVVGEREGVDLRRRLSLRALEREVDRGASLCDDTRSQDTGQCQSGDKPDGDGKFDALSTLALPATRARGPLIWNVSCDGGNPLVNLVLDSNPRNPAGRVQARKEVRADMKARASSSALSGEWQARRWPPPWSGSPVPSLSNS